MKDKVEEDKYNKTSIESFINSTVSDSVLTFSIAEAEISVTVAIKSKFDNLIA
jgi:hypothetical protein